MKIIITFGVLGAIAAVDWPSVNALDQSWNITMPATFTAVRNFVER
ncbi:MAG TPA: hypothetical protein VG105_01895 [Paraburkholderia sp.]|jgi:hypothetical protein|nr:hypothetical protein [Paraburkholderia sp.]